LRQNQRSWDVRFQVDSINNLFLSRIEHDDLMGPGPEVKQLPVEVHRSGKPNVCKKQDSEQTANSQQKSDLSPP